MDLRETENKQNELLGLDIAQSRMQHLSSTAMHDLAINPLSSSSLSLIHEIQSEVKYMEVKEEQVDCLNALNGAHEKGRDKALVQMATGLGKTTVVAADVKRYLRNNPHARVLFLCHQNRILDQARARFEQILGPKYSYGNFTGEGQDYHEVTCLFASLQAMKRWKEAFLRNEFEYIAVDESHHSKAETFDSTIRYFKPKFLLGVTGTPDRHDMQNIRDIYGPEIYQMSLEEAIAGGRLTPADYSIIIDEIAANKVLKDENGKRYNFRQLNRSIFVPLRDEEMARICEEKAKELEQVPRRLIFCSSIEQAEEFAQYFHNAAPIHSKLPKWEIKRSLDQFRSGEVQTVLTVDMFNEGIDVPEINQVVFLRLTQSKTIFLQQLGRGLRKVPGKDKVQILDFAANADRLIMLDSFWERIVRQGESIQGLAEVFRINVAETHFNETLHDVLELLAEIESNNRIFQHWTAEDSISYYKAMCYRLKRFATSQDILDAQKEGRDRPSYAVLTRKYFDHRLSVLREACNITPAPDWELVPAEWDGQDSIRIFQEMSGSKPIRNTRTLHNKLKELPQAPSLKRLLAPFNGSLNLLVEAAGFNVTPRKPGGRDWSQWTAEDSINVFGSLLAQGDTTARGLERYLRDHPELPSIVFILRPFDGKISNLRSAYEDTKGQSISEIKKDRKPSSNILWQDWTAEDSIRIFNELSSNRILTIDELERILREDRPDLPSIRIILKPYRNSFRFLKKVAEARV